MYYRCGNNHFKKVIKRPFPGKSSPYGGGPIGDYHILRVLFSERYGETYVSIETIYLDADWINIPITESEFNEKYKMALEILHNVNSINNE